MFNQFYVKQEQYRDFIKEAEKERIIKRIKEDQKPSSRGLCSEERTRGPGRKTGPDLSRSPIVSQ